MNTKILINFILKNKIIEFGYIVFIICLIFVVYYIIKEVMKTDYDSSKEIREKSNDNKLLIDIISYYFDKKLLNKILNSKKKDLLYISSEKPISFLKVLKEIQQRYYYNKIIILAVFVIISFVANTYPIWMHQLSMEHAVYYSGINYNGELVCFLLNFIVFAIFLLTGVILMIILSYLTTKRINKTSEKIVDIYFKKKQER